jgi:hypothetical protein
MDDLDLESSLRLDAVAKNLGLGRRWRGKEYIPLAVDACLEKVRKAINLDPLSSCEQVADAIAGTYQVRFEEVKTPADLEALENRYLKQQKELEFGFLRDELSDPKVEALLIQRRKANDADPDRWVAILNSLRTADRAFWNKFHELGHRLAEPAQLILPLGGVRREITARPNTLEKLIDSIAAEIAFMPEVVSRPLSQLNGYDVSMGDIIRFRNLVAPTSSLQASLNAFISRHPRLALAFKAEYRTKNNGIANSADLRINPQARSSSACKAEMLFYTNMRVPHTSCIWATYCDGTARTEIESMAPWKTSDGSSLKWNSAIVSASKIGELVYGTMEIIR